MVYQTNFNNLSFSESSQYWQLRIHILPEAVNETEPNNKLQVINECVKEVFGKDKVEVKTYQIEDQDDLQEGYDGTLSQNGKDRSQVGKEVCIYLPDSHINQLSSDEYKDKLLKLWQKLQENDVPIFCFNPPGDRSILDSNSLPTPFSFTSNNPNRDEWRDKHGILFKQFEPAGQHPILAVSFSSKDISQYGIDLRKANTRSRDFLFQHTQLANQFILQELQEINDSGNYLDFLYNDEKTTQLIKNTIAQFKKDLEKAQTLDEESTVKEAYKKKLAENEDYIRLIEGYPHETDSYFSHNRLIDELQARIINGLQDADIDRIIKGLREGFDDKFNDVVSDFDGLNISYKDYDIKSLVYKNPAKMQIVFRRQCLLNQEESLNKHLTPELFEKESFHSIISSLVFGLLSAGTGLAGVGLIVAAITFTVSLWTIPLAVTGVVGVGAAGLFAFKACQETSNSPNNFELCAF